jgi:N-acetylmuramoyl-L-alanine amidase
MSCKQTVNRLSFSLSYILFIFVFLACTAAMVALCALLSARAPLERAAADFSAPLPQAAPVIIIDAGHGGEDGGTTGHIGSREILEKHLNLDIAHSLCSLLTDAGYTAVMTRTEDRLLYDRNVDFNGRKKALDMAARLAIVEQAQNQGEVIFVSIHQNSFRDPAYSGLQVYYSPISPASATLAQSIQNHAREQLAPDNHRKIKPGGDIYLLKRLSCPAVLVECGFLSHPAECAALADETYQNRLAYAIFCALREYSAEHLGTANVPAP